MKKFNNLREESLLEKLKASDPTGKWISDFVHSDNPKFAGKSKKERIRMALGASYGAKRNEEVEQIDEISPELQHSYFKKAYAQKNDKTVPKATRQKRDKGMNKVINRTLRRNTISTPGAAQDFKDQEAKRGIGHVRDHVELDGKLVDEAMGEKAAGNLDFISKVKSGVKKVAKVLGGPDDEGHIKDLQKKMGLQQTGKKPQVKEEADICPVCETDPCICETGQHIEEKSLAEEKPGLYANIHAKRKRIAAGSGERMRKPGSKGAPTAKSFRDAAKTAKNEDVEHTDEMYAPGAAVHTPISFGAMRMKTDKKYAEKIKSSQGKSPVQPSSIKKEGVDENYAGD